MSSSFRSRFAALVFAAAVCFQGCEQRAPTPLEMLTTSTRIAELEVSIPGLMDKGGVPGLAMAIVSDTGLVWSRGFGVRNLETGDSVTENSVFEAASLSKPVFAYAVLQLVDRGVIELDTPLSEYYEYRAIAHDERHRLITPRMVLTHSPGFPNWRPRGGELTINQEPGTEFSYSGEGFVYLQLAVMELTGETLEELARRLVFEPLEMASSSYLWQERYEETTALPHDSEGEVLSKNKPRPGRGNAAASLHTTAPDFARFMAAVMTGTGLSDSMAAAMLTPQIEVDDSLTWGLGIGLQDSDDGRAFWHWGDNTGFKAFTIAYPDHGIGVVWFTNSENGHAILEGTLSATVGASHPATAWLDYEAHDSPTRIVRRVLVDVYEERGVAEAVAEYHRLRESHPPEAFDESLLNDLGYSLLRAGLVGDAVAVFELNVTQFPDASNPYDSLGEAYLAAGDTVRAIENYEKSIELDPGNTNGLAILEEIRG